MTVGSPTRAIATVSVGAIDELVRLRALLARYGESDQRGWWTWQMLTDERVYVAERLFSRTHRWAAIELATAAVTFAEEARLNQRIGVTLFHMPRSIERAVDLRLRKLKIEALNPTELVGVDIFGDRLPTLEEALREATGTVPVPRSSNGEEDGELLCLGEVTWQDLEKPDKLQPVIHRLAWAYVRSPRGSLRLPYFKLNSGRPP